MSRRNTMAVLCALVALIASSLFAQTPQIHIYKASQNPIARALASTGAMPYRAGATPGVLVVDATAAGDTLASDPAIRQALNTGSWIAVIQATEKQKREMLAPLTGGAATALPSAVYMVRLIPTRHGTATQVVDVRDDNGPQQLGSDPNAWLTPQVAQGYARAVVTQSADDAVVKQAQAYAASIPDGLLYKDYYYSSDITTDLGRSQYESRTQSTRINMLTHITIFLDNRNNPQGDFQWIAVQIDGQANPTNGGSQSADTNREKAYMQAGIYVQTNPIAAPQLAWVSTSPSNPNPTSTYTTNSSFQVGFSTSNGLNGTYTWGSSNSYELSDWGVRSASNGLGGYWLFGSQKPGNAFYNGTDLSSCDAGWMSTCFFGSGLPKDPNRQCWTPVQFHAEEVWKTSSASTQTMWVQSYASQQLLDAFCVHWSPGACWGGENVLQKWAGAGNSSGYQIDLSTVIPVPIQSLTFSENPAKAGDTVKATLTLTKPAPTAITVDLASNSQNAVVLPRTTIQQGATTVQFDILTNANGLNPGQSTDAAITAFYAQNFVRQLKVQRPQ